MTMMTTIDATTPLFTLTANFAGYTLLDGILGDMSASQFIEDYRGDEAEAAGLVEYLSPMVKRGEGYWLTEAEAQSQIDEASERGERDYANQTVTQFTIAGVLEMIKQAAADEAKFNN